MKNVENLCNTNTAKSVVKAVPFELTKLPLFAQTKLSPFVIASNTNSTSERGELHASVEATRGY